MARINWFFGCLLAGLFGLAPSVSFAATYSTNSEAIAGCLAQVELYSGEQTSENSTHTTKDTYSSKCVSRSSFPSGRTPLYTCVWKRDRVQTRKSDGQVTNFYYAGYCTNSAPTASSPSPVMSGSGASFWYADYTIPDTTGNQTSCTQIQNHCWTTNTCPTKPTFHVDFPDGSITTGSLENVCAQGCSFTGVPSWNGTYPEGSLRYTYTPSGSVCSPQDTMFDAPVDPDEEVTPEDINTDQDGDGKKDGDDPCPNDPTDTCNIPDDSKDSDGDGKPDYQDPFPNDPTNGKGDGNGSGDGNTSSGGGDCVVPPSCGGDPIQCNILFQSWAHRCGKTGGTAGEGPTGPGSPGGGNGDNSDVVSELQGLRSDLEDSLSGSPGDTDMSGFNGTREWGVADLDQSGLGFPRTCPMWQDVSFSIGVSSITLPFSSFVLHCQIFEWTGLLIVAFAGFWSVRYLIGG